MAQRLAHDLRNRSMLRFERQAYLRQFINVFRAVKEKIDAQPKKDRNPALDRELQYSFQPGAGSS